MLNEKYVFQFSVQKSISYVLLTTFKLLYNYCNPAVFFFKLVNIVVHVSCWVDPVTGKGKDQFLSYILQGKGHEKKYLLAEDA